MNNIDCSMTIKVDKQSYKIFHIMSLEEQYKVSKLPYCLKILLENLLRYANDSDAVKKQDIETLLNWDPKAKPEYEIAFTPSRVILQDFTGVPAVVDLAVMRDAMQELGGKPKDINPQIPVELVIDHSVMVDNFGTSDSLKQNTKIEFTRNKERYQFLRWGQEAFNNFKVVPPGTGIVHQVNLEYLAKVIFDKKDDSGQLLAYPDTVVGTDSHTTMINGLGVLGWGVGGIEAEAAMLGQPITMLIPQVIGFKLSGKLIEGTTATDLVLTIVEMLRTKGVVGKFVEFYGDGLNNLPLADRATIANMAPEYGATCGIFPIDNETLKFLKISGRSEHQISLIEKYARAQGLFRSEETPEAQYTDIVELNLDNVIPSIAGPKRPQDRIPLTNSKQEFIKLLATQTNKDSAPSVNITDKDFKLTNGAVVIAAITSCTNTSNPDVMLAAGLLAKKAIECGLSSKPWVKTSLAPGSQVVTEYLNNAGLLKYLEDLGFNVVGYGCTTCIGNSGPLPEPINKAITEHNIIASAVLSGNRNFEGRIHPLVKNAYLASPPLVVAYALSGSMNFDFYNDSLGKNKDGRDIYLKDIWPTQKDIQDKLQDNVNADIFIERYKSVFNGDEDWQSLLIPEGEQFEWNDKSNYVKKPPYFNKMSKTTSEVSNISNARVLVKLGDSVTTDHISPAGSIALESPAGKYLQELGIAPQDFNSYGSRRGNHEIMMRGTFANIRLQNQLAPNTEGSWTTYYPTNTKMSIFDAAIEYKKQATPLIVIAGKEYGTGSSRDWAAKGTLLLGIKVVIVESYERIHRSNLIGMGILPLQFLDGESASTYKLTGEEEYSFELNNLSPGKKITVTVKNSTNQEPTIFQALARIDTPKELEYYKNGGILQYVLRQKLN